MKMNSEYTVSCRVTNANPYWFGYKFYPGFVYKNRFYNVIWARLKETDKIPIPIDNMYIQLEIVDINDETHVRYDLKDEIVSEIDDKDLKKMLYDLTKEAYAEYIIGGFEYDEN